MKSAKLSLEEKEKEEKEKHTTGQEARISRSRRSFFHKIGLGALFASIGGQAYGLFRSIVPNVLYEEPRLFKVGLPEDFAEGSTFLEDKRVFIFREKDTFYAMSAACPHLGCTVKQVNLSEPQTVEIKGKSVDEKWEFHCPCHGSKFRCEGTNYSGPAPRPLDWVKLEVAPEDGQLVVNMSENVNQNFRLTV